ncbi:hypothetical protein K2X05_05555, partial [bacterium]|nr:hypothetical protein [bacterium]
KWLATEFDHIDVVYVGSDIACISGARIYKTWIRGAMFYFGLHKYRKHHGSALFKADGNFERLLSYAKEKNLHGLFISIYPHEKRLKTLCRRLKEARSIPTEGRLDLIRSLKYRGTHTFNNVCQEFFAIEIEGTEFVPAEVLG